MSDIFPRRKSYEVQRASRCIKHWELFGPGSRGYVEDKWVVLHKNLRYLRNEGQGCRERREGSSTHRLVNVLPFLPNIVPGLFGHCPWKKKKRRRNSKNTRAWYKKYRLEVVISGKQSRHSRDHCGLASFAADVRGCKYSQASSSYVYVSLVRRVRFCRYALTACAIFARCIFGVA